MIWSIIAENSFIVRAFVHIVSLVKSGYGAVYGPPPADLDKGVGCVPIHQL